MYQESEIVDLLMVIFLTPIMVATYRVIGIRGKQWFAAAYTMIATGYILTVVEGFVAEEVLNYIEHVTHGFAGLFCLMGAAALYRFARQSEAGAAQ